MRASSWRAAGACMPAAATPSMRPLAARRGRDVHTTPLDAGALAPEGQHTARRGGRPPRSDGGLHARHAATPSMRPLAASRGRDVHTTPRRARLSSSCRAADECSPHYVTPVTKLADASQDTDCDVLYVVGGLYGNVAALDALEEGIARERRHGLRIEVCFNGDFNFFNATSKAWACINQGVRALGSATAGNVEREAISGDGGCGCAYPDYVDGAFADRASAIVERLRDVSTDPDIAAWLSSLPFAKTYVVGGIRVCCVHGYHTVSKSKLDTRRLRAGELHPTSTPSARRCAEKERRASTGERQKQLTKTNRRPGLRERLGLFIGPPAGRVPTGPRDGRLKNRKLVRGSESRRIRMRAHVPARAPAVWKRYRREQRRRGPWELSE